MLRRKLAAQIDSDPPIHVLPRLVREFRRIDAEIRALETAEALASEDQAHSTPAVPMDSKIRGDRAIFL